MSTTVHLPNLPEKTQPHFAYSVWCQNDRLLTFVFFRVVESKPRNTSSMPTVPGVGQKKMKNAESSLLSSIQRSKEDKEFLKYNYIKNNKSQNYTSLYFSFKCIEIRKIYGLFHLFLHKDKQEKTY